LDEIQNYGGAYKSNDFLKSVLTNVKQNINKKNIEGFTANDYSHYIFATNSKWPVKVTKDDRRHFCISPSPEKIGNKEYFDNLVKRCFNDQAGRAFYDFLMSIDLSNWNPQKIPQTQFRNELIQFSQPKVVHFLSDFVDQQSRTKSEDDIIKCSLKNLYGEYLSWFAESGFSNHQKLDKNEMSAELKQFVEEHPKLNFKSFNWVVDKAANKRLSVLTFWCKISDLQDIFSNQNEVSSPPCEQPIFGDPCELLDLQMFNENSLPDEGDFKVI